MRSSGFTLLEVLVAFVIAALALGALTQGALGGLQASAVAAHTQEALARARSHLSGIGALRSGESNGDDGGGYTWRLRVHEAASTPSLRGGGAGGPGRRVALYAVSVAIGWRMDGASREVVLTTSRLGEAAVEGP